MTDKFKNITKEDDTILFNRKKINLPYTVCIIKPTVCIDQSKSQNIIDKLEADGFEIRFAINRQLTEQETQNLYYKHKKKDYYKKLVIYNSCGPSLVLLLSHKQNRPIEKLKEMMGNKDPVVAKDEDPESFRAVYGEDIVKNGIYS